MTVTRLQTCHTCSDVEYVVGFTVQCLHLGIYGDFGKSVTVKRFQNILITRHVYINIRRPYRVQCTLKIQNCSNNELHEIRVITYY